MRGKAAHVGRQFEGVNAFERALPAMVRLLDLKAAATPAQDRLGLILSRHAASLSGREPAFAMCPGLLETRFYAARSIPAFAYGPGSLTVSHGPNEFVPIRNIAQCAVIYALTAAEVLR
jgi:acetylornithine deacetylase/succinyl-diaminopimelate desuccinylase-like protein